MDALLGSRAKLGDRLVFIFGVNATCVALFIANAWRYWLTGTLLNIIQTYTCIIVYVN